MHQNSRNSKKSRICCFYITRHRKIDSRGGKNNKFAVIGGECRKKIREVHEYILWRHKGTTQYIVKVL